jgi:hypothetical protein
MSLNLKNRQDSEKLTYFTLMKKELLTSSNPWATLAKPLPSVKGKGFSRV